MYSCCCIAMTHDYGAEGVSVKELPCICGGQSSPTKPHFGISGGGSVYNAHVSGLYTVTI